MPPAALYPHAEPLPAGQAPPEKTARPAPNQDVTEAGDPAVIVVLSPEAIAAMPPVPGAESAPLSRFALLFPGRNGALANGLAGGLTATLSSSLGRSFEDVASDARARMDGQYAAMEASGKPFDAGSAGGRDGHTLMGGLDRRSLYAVASNQGGSFTAEERALARTLMSEQEAMAMGYYGQTPGLQGLFFDPFDGQPPSNRQEAHGAFLDRVGPEEKASPRWAYSRAVSQTSYELLVEQEGGTPAARASTPLADLLMKAMRTLKDNPDRSWSDAQIDTLDDLRAQPWFESFTGELDALIADGKV